MRLLASLLAVAAMTTFCSVGAASVTITINLPPYYEPIPYSSFSMGDFDVSLSTDGTDLSTWKTNFGKEGFSRSWGTNGDANNDLVVDGADFLIWQRNASKPVVPASATVPEPSAIVLTGVALAYLASSRRRWR
ncbi:PEP-CTERM sorting domain-containing protein [Lacipirellula parvula]|uniref:PEP-CTERM sorting domain-containing protein n=1 Tax=Lacipirellula parvula TaxID=2650471 RepID=UPI001561F927|nr:PEP-CTERM sorting domain-containing protein [Lacipirellula parvula]